MKMTYLRDYQHEAIKFAVYKDPIYPVLAVGEEAGELQGVVAKALRKGVEPSRERILDEIGDVLWNLAAICEEYGLTLDAAANGNLIKLSKRRNDGVLVTLNRGDA